MYAIRLLSAFAKVFTYFLQRDGFTLGVYDILVQKYADKKRDNVIKQSREMGVKIMANALDIPEDSPLEKIVDKFAEASARNPKMRAIVDRQYKKSLDSYTNDINR